MNIKLANLEIERSLGAFLEKRYHAVGIKTLKVKDNSWKALVCDGQGELTITLNGSSGVIRFEKELTHDDAEINSGEEWIGELYRWYYKFLGVDKVVIRRLGGEIWCGYVTNQEKSWVEKHKFTDSGLLIWEEIQMEELWVAIGKPDDLSGAWAYLTQNKD